MFMSVTKTLAKSVVCLKQGRLAMHAWVQYPSPTTFDIFTVLYIINEKEMAIDYWYTGTEAAGLEEPIASHEAYMMR